MSTVCFPGFSQNEGSKSKAVTEFVSEARRDLCQRWLLARQIRILHSALKLTSHCVGHTSSLNTAHVCQAPLRLWVTICLRSGQVRCKWTKLTLKAEGKPLSSSLPFWFLECESEGWISSSHWECEGKDQTLQIVDRKTGRSLGL